MALPDAYTEASLAEYMAACLGAFGTALGWDTLRGDYAEAVNDAIVAYGVDDISEATDIPKLRVLARVAIWEAAVAASASFYGLSTAGQSLSRQQMQEQAARALAVARRQALAYRDAYAVTTTSVRYARDVYAPFEQEV